MTSATSAFARAVMGVVMFSAAACGSGPGEEAPVPAPAGVSRPAGLEQAWSLRALGGKPVTVSAERARPSLIFDAKEKRVSGMAGVNRFSGTYAIEGDTLTFGPLLATKRAGPPELNELETRYLRALERTRTWRINRGELELLAGDERLARFAVLENRRER